MKSEDLVKVEEYFKGMEPHDKTIKATKILINPIGGKMPSRMNLNFFHVAYLILAIIGNNYRISFPLAFYSSFSAFIEVLLGPPFGLMIFRDPPGFIEKSKRFSSYDAFLAIICIKMQSYYKFIERKEKLEQQVKTIEEELSDHRFKIFQSREMKSILAMLCITVIIIFILNVI